MNKKIGLKVNDKVDPNILIDIGFTKHDSSLGELYMLLTQDTCLVYNTTMGYMILMPISKEPFVSAKYGATAIKKVLRRYLKIIYKPEYIKMFTEVEL